MTKEFDKPRFEHLKKIAGLSAVNLRETIGRRFHRQGGNWIEIAAVVTKTVVSLKPGVDSWVVDTGSGQHLVPRCSMAAKEISEQHHGEKMKLGTANGVISSTAITKARSNRLGIDIDDARVLEKTLRVLSVSKLVSKGFKFYWNDDGAWLLTPEYQWIGLEIKHGVPLLPTDDG